MLWRISSDTSYAQSLSLDNVQLTPGMASILTDAFQGQNEPRHVSATDGCHSRAVSRSHRNSRWHGDLWGGPRRPWRQPHQPLKRLPEGGIGTEQQEIGTSKRESHILWGRVQRTRHASRPQEGPRITEMTAPTDKQQLQSFLGMVNYMGTFIPNLSHHTEPLREMLKKKTMCFTGKINKHGPFSKSRP